MIVQYGGEWHDVVSFFFNLTYFGRNPIDIMSNASLTVASSLDPRAGPNLVKSKFLPFGSKWSTKPAKSPPLQTVIHEVDNVEGILFLSVRLSDQREQALFRTAKILPLNYCPKHLLSTDAYVEYS